MRRSSLSTTGHSLSAREEGEFASRLFFPKLAARRSFGHHVRKEIRRGDNVFPTSKTAVCRQHTLNSTLNTPSALLFVEPVLCPQLLSVASCKGACHCLHGTVSVASCPMVSPHRIMRNWQIFTLRVRALSVPTCIKEAEVPLKCLLLSHSQRASAA